MNSYIDAPKRYFKVNNKISLIILFLFLCYCNNEDSLTRSINKSPTCQIVSPINHSSYSQNDSIRVLVEARDEDNGIYSVKLFVDDELIDTDFQHPYEFLLNTKDLTYGDHIIKAIGYGRNDEMENG